MLLHWSCTDSPSAPWWQPSWGDRDGQGVQTQVWEEEQGEISGGDGWWDTEVGIVTQGSKKSGNLKSDGLDFGDGTEHGKYRWEDKIQESKPDHSSEHEWREREKEARRADTLAVLEGAVEVSLMLKYLLNCFWYCFQRFGTFGQIWHAGWVWGEGQVFSKARTTSFTSQGQVQPSLINLQPAGENCCIVIILWRSHLGKLEGKLDGETEYGDRFTESARWESCPPELSWPCWSWWKQVWYSFGVEIFFCTIHDIGRVTPEPSSSWTKLWSRPMATLPGNPLYLHSISCICIWSQF